MKKGQIKKRLQKIKEKSREEKEKIKKIVIKRKDDFLTALEKSWRDSLLRPVTYIFKLIGITANQITYSGFILLGVAIWLYFQNYQLSWQLLFLTLAAISDLLDGATARNNDNITILGTWLDHIRDGFLIIWGTYLIYQYNLLNLEIIILLFALQCLLIWLSFKDFLIHYFRGLTDKQKEILISDFSLDHLQASIVGRLQFSCWTLGYGCLLFSSLISMPILITIGHALIILEIIFASLNILEAYRKSPANIT